jgi:hypothetical protein
VKRRDDAKIDSPEQVMTVDNRGENHLVIPVIAEGAKQHGSPKIQMFVILAEDKLARRA